jgi:hypothetical protein
MAYKKTYVGTGKETQYDIKVSIAWDKLTAGMLNEYKGKKYLNLSVGKSREVKFGNTHYVAFVEKQPENFEIPNDLKKEEAPQGRFDYEPPQTQKEDSQVAF